MNMSNTDPPVASDIDRMTDRERLFMEFYDEMISQYMALAEEKAIPAMAVRIHARRRGLGQFLQELLADGVPAVAARCRQEMTVRHEFLVHLIAKFPPESDVERDEATEEMASNLAVIDSPDGGMRMLKLLDRIQRREVWRMARDAQAKVH
jgi:hypothetical protein